MQKQGWKVLLVEDDEDDILILSELLKNAREVDYSLDWKQDYQQGLLAACTGEYDAILVDAFLGQQHGVDLVQAAAEQHILTPIILLTDQVSPGKDLEALAAGATDLLDKSTLTTALLEKSIRYAIERKRIINELAGERARLRAIIENAPVGILFTDREGNFTLTNSAVEDILPGGVTGTASGPQGGYTLYHPDGTPYQPDELPLPQALKGISSREVEILVRSVDGRNIYASAYANPIHAPDGTIESAVVVMLNQTPHKIAEQAEQKANERMEWMARFPEENTNPVLRVGMDGLLQYANLAARQMPAVSIKVGEPIPEHFSDLIKQTRQANQSSEKDLLFGDHCYAFSAVPVLANEYINLYGRDITDRARMERKLYESEERFRLMGEAIPYGFWYTNIDGQTVYISPEFQKLLGLEYTPAVEINWQQALGISEADSLLFQNAWKTALKTGKYFEVEHQLVDRDGKEHYILSRGLPVYGPDGKAISMVGINLDITDRKRMESEQVEFRAQIQTQQRLIRQREMERLQVARSLHDGPFQSLNAANIGLLDAISRETDPESLEPLKWVQKAFQQQINELREFIQELRPPALVAFGLEPTIRSYVERFRVIYPGIQVELNLMKDGRLLSEEKRLSLYRIFQEIMNNAGKHSRAKNVLVSLLVEQANILLEVTDDGEGFEVPEQWSELATSEHLGLVNMRERAEMLGARLAIQSQLGQGTIVRVQIPYEPNVKFAL